MSFFFIYLQSTLYISKTMISKHCDQPSKLVDFSLFSLENRFYKRRILFLKMQYFIDILVYLSFQQEFFISLRKIGAIKLIISNE